MIHKKNSADKVAVMKDSRDWKIAYTGPVVVRGCLTRSQKIRRWLIDLFRICIGKGKTIRPSTRPGYYITDYGEAPTLEKLHEICEHRNGQ